MVGLKLPFVASRLYSKIQMMQLLFWICMVFLLRGTGEQKKCTDMRKKKLWE